MEDPDETIKRFQTVIAIDKGRRLALLADNTEIPILGLLNAGMEPVEEWGEAYFFHVDNPSMGPDNIVSCYIPVAGFPDNQTHH